MVIILVIFSALFCALGAVGFYTQRAFQRDHAGSAWRVLFWGLLLAGMATGVWAGFFLEYQLSRTLKVIGFPIPLVVFHLESGNWVDYVTDGPVMILKAASNLMFSALCLVLPVWAAFFASRFLRRRRRAGAAEQPRGCNDAPLN